MDSEKIAYQKFSWTVDLKKDMKEYSTYCLESALRFGADSLPLVQLIGLLLDCPLITAEAFAEKGIRWLMNTSDKELLSYRGMTIKGLYRLRSAFVLLKKSVEETVEEKPTITSSKVIANLLMPTMRYLESECLNIVLLDGYNRVIDIQTITVGGLNSVPIHPREVFNNAIKANAQSVILAHNHPNGSAIPSPNDLENTKRMVEAGKIVGIEVLDHIIIGDGEYISFKEEKLL